MNEECIFTEKELLHALEIKERKFQEAQDEKVRKLKKAIYRRLWASEFVHEEIDKVFGNSSGGEKK